MRSNRPPAAATPRKSHASHTPRKHQQMAIDCMERAKPAICEPLQRQTTDSTASLRTVSKTVHNDA
eukprot:821646-Lingulodinium_polyedra.AAC.1